MDPNNLALLNELLYHIANVSQADLPKYVEQGLHKCLPILVQAYGEFFNDSTWNYILWIMKSMSQFANLDADLFETFYNFTLQIGNLTLTKQKDYNQ